MPESGARSVTTTLTGPDSAGPVQQGSRNYAGSEKRGRTSKQRLIALTKKTQQIIRLDGDAITTASMPMVVVTALVAMMMVVLRVRLAVLKATDRHTERKVERLRQIN